MSTEEALACLLAGLRDFLNFVVTLKPLLGPVARLYAVRSTCTWTRSPFIVGYYHLFSFFLCRLGLFVVCSEYIGVGMERDS